MSKTYLSDAGVKQLQKIAREFLPKEKIKQIKKAQEVYPYTVYNNHQTDVWKNMEVFRTWRFEQFMKDEPDNYKKILEIRHMQGGTATADINANVIFEPYFKKWEWLEAVIWTPFYQINHKLNNEFTHIFGVDPVYVWELVDAGDTDKYIEEKYSKKYLDKDIMERTNKLLENIDNWYMGVPYDVLEFAMKVYLNDGDREKFHNYINKDRK